MPHASSSESPGYLSGRQQLLQKLSDLLPAAVYLFDVEKRCTVYTSRAFSVATGREAGELEALGSAMVPTIIYPDDFPRFVEELERAKTLADGEESVFESRVLHKNGTWRWFQCRSTIFERNSAGLPKLVLGIAIDITDHRRAEYAARCAHERAEAASRAKDQFLAVLSHELRTPLTPVLASVGSLRDHPELPASLREELAMIHRNIELESRLIDDLLDLTRVTRGKLILHQELLDVHKAIFRSVEICRGEIEQKRIGVTLELQAEVSTVHADPGRLQQILWNLLKNAVKFTPTGGAIRVRTSSRDDRHIAIEIVDSGIGIEPAILPVLFDAFEQGGKHMTLRYGGLGLGLAISRALVEQHGGTLAAASEGRDKGSTFTVELPVVCGVTASGASAPQMASRAARPMRILLVEDHPDTSRTMLRLLQTFGHVVMAADTIAAALALLRQERFDLVLSDIGLPDGTGHELMKAAREFSNVYAIALSGYGMDEDLRRSRDAGFSDHLTKPVSIAQLQRALAQAALNVGAPTDRN